jgi:Arc/MetJ-type ribon-helix-helix transcriptional regulator
VSIRDVAKKLTDIRIDSELLAGLERLRESRGVPVSEQVRRAIQDWLAKNGVKRESGPPSRVNAAEGLTRQPV